VTKESIILASSKNIFSREFPTINAGLSKSPEYLENPIRLDSDKIENWHIFARGLSDQGID